MKRLIYILFILPVLSFGQIDESMLDYYERLVFKQYGDNVSFDSKGKVLAKFGRNTDLDTGVEEQVWVTGGTETLSTSNDITHFASSASGDTQDIVVEGHTIDGSGNFTFVTQTVTLAGQTKTALTTPLARCTRMYNDGATDFAGTVYISKDVTYTAGVPASGIALQTTGTNNQSLKAATTISNNDYWFITEIICSVERAATALVDFKIQVREKGKVFRTKKLFTVNSNTGTVAIPLNTPIIVPPNSDVRVMANSTANNVIVDAYLDGFLAIKY